MKTFNEVKLEGPVGSEPQLRENEGGMVCCTFKLGTEGPRQMFWHTIVTWANLARSCKEHVRKGDWVSVVGFLNYRDTRIAGVKRKAFEVTAMDVFFPKEAQ